MYVITIRTENEDDVEVIKQSLEDAIEEGEIEGAFDLHVTEEK